MIQNDKVKITLELTMSELFNLATNSTYDIEEQASEELNRIETHLVKALMTELSKQNLELLYQYFQTTRDDERDLSDFFDNFFDACREPK